MSVYPDSDKVSGPEGILLRRPKPGYWHGEGSGEVDMVVGERGPLVLDGPPRPVVNLDTTTEVHGSNALELGGMLGAERLAARLVELEAGETPFPYSCVYGREQWLLVLRGRPSIRRVDGSEVLEPGDVIVLPDGPAGGHAIGNDSGEPARVILFSTTDVPAIMHHEDSGYWIAETGPDGESTVLIDAPFHV